MTYTYYDERGFSMRYPHGWLRQNIGQALLFIVPQTAEDKDAFQENLSVLCQHLEAEQDLESYTTRNMTQLINGYQLLSPPILEDTKIADYAAKSLYCEIETENTVLAIQQWWVVINYIGIVLTYSATKDSFKVYQSEMFALVNSFSLLSAPPPHLRPKEENDLLILK